MSDLRMRLSGPHRTSPPPPSACSLNSNGLSLPLYTVWPTILYMSMIRAHTRARKCCLHSIERHKWESGHPVWSSV